MSKVKPNKPKVGTESGGADGPRASGAYFLSLELENVRCFSEKQTLDLTDGQGRPARWTILLGENGVGKTTVLQVLAGLQFEYKYSFIGSSPAQEFNMYKKFHDLISLGKFTRNSEESISHRAPLELSARIGYGIRLISDRPNSEIRINYWQNGPLAKHGQRNSSRSSAVLKCHAYGAGRRFDSRPALLSQEISDDASSSLFDEEVSLNNPEKWLLQLDYSVSKRSRTGARQNERLEQVKDLLINILPDVADIRFDAGSGVVPKPKVEFQTPYGWVPLHQLGYGYRTMIAWVVDLASRMVERYPDSADPLAEPAVVLVDEIDLHLHPQWQRKLIAYLTERFPNTQFIATAHSPLIVQAAIDANFALLRREGDHVVIDNDVEPMPGATIEQILTSELFGLKSLRPPKLDMLLERRQALLTKPKLTKADQKELTQLEKEIGPLPVGETHDQARKMMDLVEETQRLLRERAERKP